MMKRRKVDILCVQETKWKGNKAREMGDGYKLYYTGEDGRRNGVGIVLSPELKGGVLQVNRESDRIIWMKAEVEKVTVHIISAYAPQTSCEAQEKYDFWSMLGDLLTRIPEAEAVWIGADFNGHVGEGSRGASEVLGNTGSE